MDGHVDTPDIKAVPSDQQQQVWTTSNNSQTIEKPEEVKTRGPPIDGGYGWVCVAGKHTN